MRIYDVTVTISAETPIYKGDPGVEFTSFKAIAAGSSANVSQISIGVHTATHIDAPNHFIDGAKRIHEIDPAKLIGPCRVIAMPENVIAIEPEHVGNINGVERVIFKTQNSAFWSEPKRGFRTDFSYLTPPTAKLLAIVASFSSASIICPSKRAALPAIRCISLCSKKRSSF